MEQTTHVVQYYDSGRWSAVPANNGGNGPTWQWGEEILTGFTVGTYELKSKGHQTTNYMPFVSWLARSLDGGESWNTWMPKNYAGQPGDLREIPRSVDFSSSGFVMRVEGAGYHGNDGARWFLSENRGASWLGPFGFGDLLQHPELSDKEFTGRTAYIVNSRKELYVFLSVRERTEGGSSSIRLAEKTFMAKTIDGGASFALVAWIVPWQDPSRAVMPAPVRCPGSELVVTLRRKSETKNWIDCYGSMDDGATWQFRSMVGYTEDGNRYNGNPPAMVRLTDGRLCCVYGNRSDLQILCRFSSDHGATWTEPRVLRDNFQSVNQWPDLGYCRIFQRPDGLCVTNYFWCTPERPQTHIEVSIFDPAE